MSGFKVGIVRLGRAAGKVRDLHLSLFIENMATGTKTYI